MLAFVGSGCSDSISDAPEEAVEFRSDSNCSSEQDLGCDPLPSFVFEYPLPWPSAPGCKARITLRVFKCEEGGVVQYRFEEDHLGVAVISPTGSPCFVPPGEVERAYDLAVEAFMTDFSLALINDDCNNDLDVVSSLQYRVTCQRLCSENLLEFDGKEWVHITRLRWEPCVESPGCCVTEKTWCYDRESDEFVTSEPISSVIADCSGNPIDPTCNGLMSTGPSDLGVEAADESQCQGRCDF